MNPEIDGIQAPKKRVTKQQIPVSDPIPIPQAPAPPCSNYSRIQTKTNPNRKTKGNTSKRES